MHTIQDVSSCCAAAFDSSLGSMAIVWRKQRVQQLAFGCASRRAALRAVGWSGIDGAPVTDAMQTLVERLQRWADGAADDLLDIPLDLTDRTPFQRAVIAQCRRIPRGQVRTYGELARRAGFPGAARAVGSVMAGNRVPLIVPCHRVVAAAGRLGGFSAPQGLSMKRRLLRLEGSL